MTGGAGGVYSELLSPSYLMKETVVENTNCWESPISLRNCRSLLLYSTCQIMRRC